MSDAQLARVALATTLLVSLSTSCGLGSGLAASSVGDPGEPPKPTTLITDVVVGPDPEDTKTSPVEVRFRLSNSGSKPAEVVLRYTSDGAPGVPIDLVGDPDLSALATAPSGVEHTFLWDFAAQLPTGADLAQSVALTVHTADLTAAAAYGPFDLGNDAAALSVVSFPSAETAGIVAVPVVLSDSSSDLVSVSVQYDDYDAPSGWKDVTSLGGGLDSVETTPAGVPATLFWDTVADAPSKELRAALRFVPNDGTTDGAPVEIGPLVIDNNAEPLVLLNGSAFFATPDERRGLGIPYEVHDDEDDTVTTVFQWSTESEAFPDLPASLAEVEAILADPLLRAQYRIASEAPGFRHGGSVPIDPVRVRLPELRRDGTASLGGPVGCDLELLRPPGVLVSTADAWASNDLVGPVGAVPLDTGVSALVVDEPAPGTWRLREVDLATGALLRDVAAGADGRPTCLSRADTAEHVLLATETGGVWRVARIEVSTGAAETLAVADGSTALGAVRGLVAWGPERALLSVASSLVAVAGPQPSTQTTLLADLEGPAGLASGTVRPGVVYVAEQDWVNPDTSAVEGRVVAIDLSTLERTSLATSGLAPTRPVAVAGARGGTVLLVVTDASASDGTRELRAIHLAGEQQGLCFELASALPTGVGALATGPDELTLVPHAAANELLVAGGLQQVRTVVAFDPATGEAEVDAPFDPPLGPGQTWRVWDRIRAAAPSSCPEGDLFVWDSADLAAGGSVVLRAIPYDQEGGTGSDTGVPRTVRAALDVAPEVLGGPGQTDGVAALLLADLSGDGRPDLVTANAGSDSVAIFHQTDGGFPGAPDSVLSGIPILLPMLEPVDVVALDLADDGLLDLVTADRGSDDLTTQVQLTPGVLLPTLSLGTALTAPESLATGDFDGDGRTDLVAAGTGSDTVGVFLQTALGAFPPIESQTIASVLLQEPRDVTRGDLDADGDLDLVVACAGLDAYVVLENLGAGVFDATGVAHGGPEFTDGPAGVAVGDVDGDGLLDVVGANEGGDSLSIFLQGAGGLPILPDAALSSSTGPTGPRSIEILDADADGDLDVASIQSAGDVRVFLWDAALGAHLPTELVLGEGSLTLPRSSVASDVDGDGRTDLLVANSGASSVAIFRQAQPAQFGAGQALGGGVPTPGLAGLAVADLDDDGDLDLVTADAGDGTLALFGQLSPTVFPSAPAQKLAAGGPGAGTSAVTPGDVNGDGRVDLFAVNEAAGELRLFLQEPSGFPELPSQVLADGLDGPAQLALGDLNGDGRDDVACALAGGDELALFLQTPSGYPSGPDARLGDASSTAGPRSVAAADLDGDGDLDLVSANTGGDDLAVFHQTSANFAAAPGLILGGPASTPSPTSVRAGDLDGDGRLDLLSTNAGANGLALFLQTSGGSFSGAPSGVLGDPLLIAPGAADLADVDLDGDLDVVAGGGDHLLVFRQIAPGAFTAGAALGGPGVTDAPSTVLVADVDGDGDPDLVSAHPPLQAARLHFAAH